MSKFDNAKFKELLRKGIGDRTQKEFAECVQMSPVSINRMLNGDCGAPTQRTLEVFARHMRTVTLKELYEACGYAAPNIEQVIRKVENSVDDFFRFRDDIDVWNSLQELQSSLLQFMKKCTNNEEIKIDIRPMSDTERNTATSGTDIDEAYSIRIDWNYDKTDYRTYHYIGCAVTRSGKLIILEANKYKDTVADRRARAVAEERLLEQIFGTYDTAIITIPGLGLEFEETEQTIATFIHNHAATFCTTPERISMYQRLVNGESVDKIFSSFYGVHDIGLGAVVEDIIRSETGLNFEYFYPETDNDEDVPSLSCIIIPGEEHIDDLIKTDPQLFKTLLRYARELNAPYFGAVYHKTYTRVKKEFRYSTAEQYLT